MLSRQWILLRAPALTVSQQAPPFSGTLSSVAPGGKYTSQVGPVSFPSTQELGPELGESWAAFLGQMTLSSIDAGPGRQPRAHSGPGSRDSLCVGGCSQERIWRVFLIPSWPFPRSSHTQGSGRPCLVMTNCPLCLGRLEVAFVTCNQAVLANLLPSRLLLLQPL